MLVNYRTTPAGWSPDLKWQSWKGSKCQLSELVPWTLYLSPE